LTDSPFFYLLLQTGTTREATDDSMAEQEPDNSQAETTARAVENGSKRKRDYVVGVTPATVAHLQEMIRDGRMKAGEPLPSQRDLARDLKVSRATLREALSILATIGQITARPNGRGFIANPEDVPATPSWRFAARYSLNEVYQFRHIAESYAAQQAAITRTDQEIEELKESFEAFRKAAQANDLVAYARADFEFHQLIMRIARNKLLVDMHQTFASVLLESQRLPTERRGNIWNAVNEHKSILEAIVMNDPDGASYYMRKHISMASNRSGLSETELR
jgi:GntR family transcriptional repressor for pyruvate dehydrogenase complex